MGDLLYSDAKRREATSKSKKRKQEEEELETLSSGPQMLKSSFKMMQKRLIQEFDAACLARGYEDSHLINKEEVILLLQEIGYLTRMSNYMEAPVVTLIEQPAFQDLWHYLTAYTSPEENESEAGFITP